MTDIALSAHISTNQLRSCRSADIARHVPLSRDHDKYRRQLRHLGITPRTARRADRGVKVKCASCPSSWIAHEQAAHLPRVVGQAGQTAPGNHARARGRRRRRALDDHVQPGAVYPRPARRALPGGRFRRVRVRPGRLDHDGCVPVRPGVAARQRCVRGWAVRRCARHPAHVHHPRERFEAAHRPAWADLRPL